MDLAERLVQELTPDVDSAGLFLEAVEIKGSPPQRIIRVVIDLPSGTGGVSSDQIDSLTRELSVKFDDFEFLGNSPFTLEVSTPGLSRPLTTPRHFDRAKDRYVAITTQAGTIKGTVINASAHEVTIREDQGKEHQIPLDQITSARYEIKW